MAAPRRTYIKICGITNAEDAQAAADLGADAVGFIFAPSPRRIEPSRARPIIASLPPHVVTVGVFVDASAQEIAAGIEECRAHAAQLHGGEPPEFLEHLHPLPLIKALRVGARSDLDVIPSYAAAVAILLDAYVAGRPGGTGTSFDWRLAARAKRFERPIILAGGLTPDNVGEAIARVRPLAVDVGSGVEREPGRKDHARMEQFIQAVRAADREQP